MSRDYAKTNTTIIQDQDYRDLPFPAALLYKTMWDHPDLTYCGVLDWRPGRLAAIHNGLTSDMVRAFGDCLQARHFLVIDDDTEEALIRSWVRWDGLMKQPRLAVSFAKAYSSVASNKIRQVIVFELRKLAEMEPGLPSLKDPRVVAVLSQPAVSVRALPQVEDPLRSGFVVQFGTGLGNTLGTGLGQTEVDASVPPTPSPSPSPISLSEEAALKRDQTKGTRLSEDWRPSEDLMAELATMKPLVDLESELAAFFDYWLSKSGKDATKVDWGRTFRGWVRRANPTPGYKRPTNGHAVINNPQTDQSGYLPGRGKDESSPPILPPPSDMPPRLFRDWNATNSDRWRRGQNPLTDWRELEQVGA